jgi:hypothetical protein
MSNGAEKTAQLLKFLRDKQLSDAKIMEELGVKPNAYYTLRSRLNQKIEEYLLQQMENPRTDLLKKVANIEKIIFTKKRTIAITTLKKLEKELLDYDLSNELTIIYKLLKRLHINHEDHFTYKQLYNKHIAYMLAFDKSEDIVAEYFKKYGQFFLTNNSQLKFELSLLFKEIVNVSKLYQSHRLYVNQSLVYVFHRLFVDEGDPSDASEEPVEDVLREIERIFEIYYLDTTYYHLKKVLDFLKFEYYTHHKVYKKAEKYYEEVNSHLPLLISNYGLYTFPPILLFTKLNRALRIGLEKELYEETKSQFQDFETNSDDLPQYITYYVYRALVCYYADKFDEASKWLNKLLNEISFKKYPEALLEVKLLLLLQYCLLDDQDLFNQLLSSTQRQIRALGRENCDSIVSYLKMLRVSISESGKPKLQKIKALMGRIFPQDYPFSTLNLIKFDEKLLELLM